MRAIVILAMIAYVAVGGAAMAKAPGYKVWSVSSLQKVLPDEAVAKGASSEIVLCAARGESESAQVVITAAGQPLEAVRVSLNGLSGPRGASIPASAIELCRVGYIDMPTLKRIAPDPLPPATPFAVLAGKNQPVWITISVPRDAEPGAYSGELVVKPSNGPERRMAVNLKVWNFSIPVAPSMITAFGIHSCFVAPQHGIADNSPAMKRLYSKYYWFLVDRRISPYSPPVPLNSPEAARYINDPRLTSYQIPYSDNVDEMRATVDSLRKRNLLSKGFVYGTDEPAGKESYDRLEETSKKIQQVDPKLRIICPFWCDPTFDAGGKTIYELADGLLNIWCPNLEYFNKDKIKAKTYDKLKKGEEFWWYICCGPRAPYPNFFISMDGPSHRALPWMNWKYNCKGFLYWSTTWWRPGGVGSDRPWEDQATSKDVDKDLYGDGSLLYPGKQVGVDGPVSSIRLELLREGLEDYEYLVLLEKKIGRAGAEEFVSRLISKPNKFSHDPAKWAAVREAIGEELSR